MNATSAVSAYNRVGIESSVVAADPHRLVSMLFQGALLAIASAKISMQNKDTPAKGAAISKAISIIGEGLHASLDKKAGGELAEQLASLYDYMVRRLFEANLKNDPAILDEISSLLNELKGAWDSIRGANSNNQTAAAPAISPTQGSVAHGRR